VCDKRYVINAEAMASFSPADHCPAYKVPEDLAAAVLQKQRRDDIETTRLIIRGTQTAPVTTGGAGGMNPIFRAAVKSQGGPGAVVHTTSGTIPADVYPHMERAEATFQDSVAQVPQ
jgi:hypothetical protein